MRSAQPADDALGGRDRRSRRRRSRRRSQTRYHPATPMNRAWACAALSSNLAVPVPPETAPPGTSAVAGPEAATWRTNRPKRARGVRLQRRAATGLPMAALGSTRTAAPDLAARTGVMRLWQADRLIEVCVDLQWLSRKGSAGSVSAARDTHHNRGQSASPRPEDPTAGAGAVVDRPAEASGECARSRNKRRAPTIFSAPVGLRK